MLGFISFVKNIMCIKIYKTKNDAATYYLKKYKSFICKSGTKQKVKKKLLIRKL